MRLIQGDAQSLNLPSGGADAVFSRFGVMAFDDPLAAFVNFRRILRSSGLAFSCWRSLKQNELDYLPLSAAGLEALVDERLFSFADSEHMRSTSGAAEFNDVTVQPHDEKVSSGDLDAMISALLKVGPLEKIIRENPALRSAAEPRLGRALGRIRRSFPYTTLGLYMDRNCESLRDAAMTSPASFRLKEINRRPDDDGA